MISIYLFDATCPIPICRFSGADKIIHYENGGDPTFTAGDVTIGLLNGGGILNASAYFMGSYNFPDFAPKVRQFRIVFGTIFRAVLQLHPTPTRAVCDALIGAHADRVLIGAWNSMVVTDLGPTSGVAHEPGVGRAERELRRPDGLRRHRRIVSLNIGHFKGHRCNFLGGGGWGEGGGRWRTVSHSHNPATTSGGLRSRGTFLGGGGRGESGGGGRMAGGHRSCTLAPLSP